MNDLERAITDAVTIGAIIIGLLFLQVVYGTFETVRHLFVDGWNDHTFSHFKSCWPIIFFILYPSSIKVGFWYLRNKFREF